MPTPRLYFLGVIRDTENPSSKKLDILTTIVSFFILGGLITSPFLILYWLNRRSVKYEFMAYLALGITTTAILTFLLAWWSYARIKFYYHIMGMMLIQ